jgi:DNA-binding transcriptional ArsR family regulator
VLKIPDHSIINRNIAIEMGITKSAGFSAKDNKVAAYAKALAHPARVAILRLLLKKQSCICGDIVDELPLSQSTVSQHLRELKESGLIKGDVDGVKVCYCIDEKEWEHAKHHLEALLNTPISKLNCC